MVKSAGLLLYRLSSNELEVLLIHPGGPFWAKKDLGAWSIPKGEFDDDENALDAAIREMEEESGKKVEGNFIELTPVRIKSGKTIYAWAIENEFDPADLKSNFFEIEWPPKSGIKKSFPEVDKAEWFKVDEAKVKINAGQVPLIVELERKIK